MPTYVYETIPEGENESPERFEISQRMTDAALTHHPETGRPVRRLISGGSGFLGGTSSSAAPVSAPVSTGTSSGHQCRGGCKH